MERVKDLELENRQKLVGDVWFGVIQDAIDTQVRNWHETLAQNNGGSMSLKSMTDEQLEEAKANHDCHLSPNDGCQFCQDYYEEKAVREAEKDVRDDALVSNDDFIN